MGGITMKSLELATSSNNMGLKCKDSMDSPCFFVYSFAIVDYYVPMNSSIMRWSRVTASSRSWRKAHSPLMARSLLLLLMKDGRIKGLWFKPGSKNLSPWFLKNKFFVIVLFIFIVYTYYFLSCDFATAKVRTFQLQSYNSSIFQFSFLWCIY